MLDGFCFDELHPLLMAGFLKRVWAVFSFQRFLQLVALVVEGVVDGHFTGLVKQGV